MAVDNCHNEYRNSYHFSVWTELIIKICGIRNQQIISTFVQTKI